MRIFLPSLDLFGDPYFLIRNPYFLIRELNIINKLLVNNALYNFEFIWIYLKGYRASVDSVHLVIRTLAERQTATHCKISEVHLILAQITFEKSDCYLQYTMDSVDNNLNKRTKHIYLNLLISKQNWSLE